MKSFKLFGGFFLSWLDNSFPTQYRFTPKADDSAAADPSANLMTMMKQMYEDGDDDMKRTIAKAWTESRDKQPGADEMGGQLGDL